MINFLKHLLSEYSRYRAPQGSPANWTVEPTGPVRKNAFDNVIKGRYTGKIFFGKNIANILLPAHAENQINNLINYLENEYTIYGEKYFPYVYEECSLVRKKSTDNECYKKISSNTWDDRCSGCKIKWLYSVLSNIEDRRIDNDMVHSSISYNLETWQRQTINDLFEKIIAFEENYIPGNSSFEKALNLLNDCLICLKMPNERNKKLAYVKWYTAHLMVWPPLKALLKTNNFYNEQIIYNLLNSAAHIQAMFSGVEDMDELYTMESEKIISFLSCESEHQNIMNNFQYYLNDYAALAMYGKTSRAKTHFLINSYFLATKTGNTVLAEITKNRLDNYVKNNYRNWHKESKEKNALTYIHEMLVLNNISEDTLNFFIDLYNNEELNTDPDIVMQIYAYRHSIDAVVSKSITTVEQSLMYKKFMNEVRKADIGEGLYAYSPVITFEKPSRYIRIFGDKYIPNYIWERNILDHIEN